MAHPHPRRITPHLAALRNLLTAPHPTTAGSPPSAPGPASPAPPACWILAMPSSRASRTQRQTTNSPNHSIQPRPPRTSSFRKPHCFPIRTSHQPSSGSKTKSRSHCTQPHTPSPTTPTSALPSPSQPTPQSGPPEPQTPTTRKFRILRSSSTHPASLRINVNDPFHHRVLHLLLIPYHPARFGTDGVDNTHSGGSAPTNQSLATHC